MTVSRVINGEEKVRASTRDLVNAAIASTGYAPNTAARMLAGAGQNRIALLFSNPSAGYLSEFLVGSLEQASRSDVQLVVEKCEIGEHEVSVAVRLIKAGIAGFILPSPLCDSADLLRTLLDSGTPTVAVATDVPTEGSWSIAIDDRAAALAMTRHIVALGHQRVGFITGNPNQTASRKRLEGYREGLAEAGIAADDRLIEGGLFTYRSGFDAARRLLERDSRPSAIFASNDDMAAATVAVAHRCRLDVPRDLTVCGFDDTPLATAIWPELTTVHQPIADMSRTAVEMLVRSIRAPRHSPLASEHRIVEFRIVQRGSDGPPCR